LFLAVFNLEFLLRSEKTPKTQISINNEVYLFEEERHGLHIIVSNSSRGIKQGNQHFFPIDHLDILESFFSKLTNGTLVLGITSGALTPEERLNVANSAMKSVLLTERDVLQKAQVVAFVGVTGMPQKKYTFDQKLLKKGWKVVWARGTKIEPQLDPSALSDQVAGVRPGGHWSPSDCEPRFNVAIIIPYKDQQSHLKVFTYNLANFLKRQNLAFSIYAIEPTGRVLV
jgi:hypothetical protein